MTDDELIVLWSLAGMELWAEFKSMRDLEWFVRLQTESGVLLTPVAIRRAWFFNSEDEDILYRIDDEHWWKLLFAKHWYERNKGQFHD